MTDGLPSPDDFRNERGQVDWDAYRKAAVVAATAEAFDEVEEQREKEEPPSEG